MDRQFCADESHAWQWGSAPQQPSSLAENILLTKETSFSLHCKEVLLFMLPLSLFRSRSFRKIEWTSGRRRVGMERTSGIFYKLNFPCVYCINNESHIFPWTSLPCAVRIDWVTMTSASRDVLKVYPFCRPSVRGQLTKWTFLVWVLRLNDRSTHSSVSVMEVQNTKVEKEVTSRSHLTDPETHH